MSGTFSPIAPRPAPVKTEGFVPWVRANLFGNPTSAATTSSMATGSVRDVSHRGSTMTGRRAARSRTMSQLRLPWPTIMLARSSTAGTAPARSTAPTSRRLRRCSDACGPAGATPPRYTTRLTPALAAARAKRSAWATSRA